MLRSRLAIAALAGGFLLAAGTGAGTASAAQPCWRTVINDWYDGQIDGRYSASCYREALKNAPDDLKIYSDLPEDLNRALQSSVRSLNGHNRPQGPVGKVLDGLGPSRADSVPIPLLVLAGLALLLIAGGAVGMFSRRAAARRGDKR